LSCLGSYMCNSKGKRKKGRKRRKIKEKERKEFK
jgi:hypothetical protein